MPDLTTALREQDLGYLRIIADFWGVRLAAPDLETARLTLVADLLDPTLVEEIVAALPADAAAALADLMQNAGRLPWVRFTGRYGAFRQMGVARREREKPYANDPSSVETLYYHGLIARAFMETPEGPQEFAYIPDDLLPLLPFLSPGGEPPLGRPAADSDCTHTRPADDTILDDATTVLAALRSGMDENLAIPAPREAFLRALLVDAGLLLSDLAPDVENTRAFLEAPRSSALQTLALTWLESPAFNDLRLVPTLEAEGEWQNDPLLARRHVFEFLSALPADVWWSLPAWIAAIKDQQPEFQRPDGNFDSWFLKDRESGEYLRGIDRWDAVEGALLGWMIAGPLHWLGFVDLADSSPDIARSPAAGVPPRAFRVSRWAADLLQGRPPQGLRPEDEKIHVRSDGRILVPRLAPRAARYLVARFCEWEAPGYEEYRYRPTPASLSRASDFGLRVGQLIALLARHTDGIPANVTRALKDWQVRGVAARIGTFPVLRLPSAEALAALRASRGARFLGDVLGPAAVAIRPGTEGRVQAVLVELGYLCEIDEIA